MFEYCVRHIYNYAHEIIIVEGATKALTHRWDGDTTSFTNTGRSTDGTIEYLYELQKKYPKIKIIIGDGFWNGKTEMCNAYASIATGDYIWQLDSDEFYKDEDINKILDILDSEEPYGVHFYANHFCGGWDYCIDEKQKTWGNDIPWKRIFKNVPKNSFFVSHEPPKYICNGKLCDNEKTLDRDYMLNNYNIKMYHYSYVHYPQINFKSKFFRNNKYVEFWNNFIENKNTLIFGSSPKKFEGLHPQIIQDNYIIQPH
jgi:hypothetical protein